MSDAPFLPRSSPFAAPERAALDSLLVAATPQQRAWLAGFLVGLDAREVAAPAVAVPQVPLTVLFASESGNAETLSRRIAKLARGRGFKPTTLDFADLDVARLPQLGSLLVIAATWGEGEPPSRAAHGFAALMGDGAPRLEGVRFGVLSLGDTSYAEFCAVGRQIDARLDVLGATRVLDRVDCDLDFEEPAAAWIETALQRPRAGTPGAGVAGRARCDRGRYGATGLHGGGGRADQPQLLTLRQGDDPPGTRLRCRGAAL